MYTDNEFIVITTASYDMDYLYLMESQGDAENIYMHTIVADNL